MTNDLETSRRETPASRRRAPSRSAGASPGAPPSPRPRLASGSKSPSEKDHLGPLDAPRCGTLSSALAIHEVARTRRAHLSSRALLAGLIRITETLIRAATRARGALDPEGGAEANAAS